MEAVENTKLIFETEIRRVFAYNIYNKALPYFYLSLPRYIQCDSFFVNLYKKMSEKSRASYYGKLMKKALRFSEGKLAPDFSSRTIDGPNLSLKEVIAKSKLTIVDFWGASCGPCRKEFRTSLVPLYQEFHDKGLSVIGVSWDDYKSENWRKAIHEDHLTWYQVAGQEIFELYNPEASPANVVIDEEGKIVAWNVFGLELNWLLDKNLTK
jgi:peroxiredoxin